MADTALRLTKPKSKEETPIDAFRVSLKDVIEYSTKLSPICKSIDEMVQLCDLAMTNDAQAELLMRIIGDESK